MEIKVNVEDCSLSKKLIKFLKDNNICVSIQSKCFTSYKDVQSFEDALEYLGECDEYADCTVVKPHHYALYKLETIIKAINKIEKWVPNWNNSSQKKWRPWFYLGSPGFRFDGASYRNTFASAGCASRLHLPSEEIATYVGKEFIDLWEQSMV